MKSKLNFINFLKKQEKTVIYFSVTTFITIESYL
jgi:hypothetical protein